jgi:hypothetical protein
VIGTPGIGKSVFAWWFIRCLAALGCPVVYCKEKTKKNYLCKGGSVLVGSDDAFDYLLQDANTW